MRERLLMKRDRRGPPPERIDRRPVGRSQIMQLQRTIGNVAVQRRLWDNVPAKFQTQNDLGARNSEYRVTTTGYTRYAPVNILRRIFNEVYFNKPSRSFVYLTGMPANLNTPEYDALFEHGRVQSVVGGSVTFTSRTRPASPPVVADIGPSDGALVFDANVDNNGRVTDPHVGHPVTELGRTLPTLDDPYSLGEVQKKWAGRQAQQQTAAKRSPYI